MSVAENQNASQPVIGRPILIGLAIGVLALGLGLSSWSNPESPSAVAAAILGVVGMLIGGYGVSRRPKDSITLLLAAATAVLGGFATNPAWDAIRLMQWVMAGTAAVCAVIILLPQTGQRVAFSLLVFYHFAGVLSAVTSPRPTPWMTSQLWSRVFRPHLEFSYMNNAYQFYSPQPGPAPDLHLPAIQRTQLSNGLPVWTVELHKVLVAQINLVVLSGSADDPARRFGAASMTAAMLEEGAGARSALEIADAVTLDPARFERDLDSGEARARVERALAGGRENGVTGTPTLFVDGIRYYGAWDYHSMLEALERPVAARVHRSARVFASFALTSAEPVPTP